MNMKRILILFAAIALAIPGVQAQEWLDALKKSATTTADKATGGKLTEMALYGTWTYTQPSVKFEGEGLAASFGGSFIETLIVDQLAKIYARVGLTTGQGTLTFTKEKQTVTAAFDGHQIEGTYVFDAESHDITFSLANGKLDMKTAGKQLFKELGVALINACMISLLVFVYNWFFLDNMATTVSVSLSLFAVVIFASIFGTLVPLTLERFKIDPAIATGPFITITNDIIGMLIYMSISYMLST